MIMMIESGNPGDNLDQNLDIMDIDSCTDLGQDCTQWYTH